MTERIRRLQAGYGAHSLHALVVLGSLGLAGYVIVLAAPNAALPRMAIWFGAAVIGHDLILFPLYSLADRALGGLLSRAPLARRTISPRNYLRIPTLAAGLLLLVYLPGVIEQGQGSYRAATGQTQAPYLGRWLAITATLFTASAVVYVLRLLRARRRTPQPEAPASTAAARPHGTAAARPYGGGMFGVYDTRMRQVIEVGQAHRGELRVYDCGPTVYRYAHVGNLRTYMLSDLIRRAAQRRGRLVIVCQNITDVGHLTGDDASDATGEDKMLAQARAEGRPVLEIAREIEDAFHADMSALNIHPADYQPRASESIELMIEMIAKLIEGGHAYPDGQGSVYFDARSFPGYGELSGNRLTDLQPGSRTGGEVEAGKRFHADWALWKSKPDGGELTWPTPWGTGFPGWHTECSAMLLHHLGEHVDVHTAGVDLRFPHHENERAQSNSVTGHDVVRGWVHGEHLLFEGRKMSKSAGNVVLLRDLTDRGLDPLALRLAFLEHRFRQQMNLTWDTLEAADKTLRRWRERAAEWANSPSAPAPARYAKAAVTAFEDDLDTPTALRELRGVERDPDVPAGAKFETFAYLDRLFGLDLVRDVGKPAAAPELPGGAADRLAARAKAREASDWAASDRLRDELAAMGVTVADTPDGQAWSVRR
jgi:cysteinyl-tRNA synthetase